MAAQNSAAPGMLVAYFSMEYGLLDCMNIYLDARTNLGIPVIEEVKKYFQDKVYKTIIPRNVRLSEAPSHGEPIITYDAKSRGAEVYLDLAKEVVSNG
jgi:chromosome partitioning protein